MIDYQRRRWNKRRLEELFVPSDVRILEKNQPAVTENDFWEWKYNRNGVYSVKTGYDLAFLESKKSLTRSQTEKTSLNPLKAQVWDIQAPSKLKLFLWKGLSGALSVFDAIKSRGMRCESVCQTCGIDGESINHVLFSCTLARQVWAISQFPHPRGGFNELSVYANLDYLFRTWRNKDDMRSTTKIFPWILWYFWKNRNSLLFEGVIYEGEQIYKKSS